MHRIEMARLRREVEQEIPAIKQMPHRGAVTDIGDIEPHPLAQIGDVGGVGARVWHHTVYEKHVAAEPDKPPRQGRSDQSDPAGDHYPCAAKPLEPRIYAGNR